MLNREQLIATLRVEAKSELRGLMWGENEVFCAVTDLVERSVFEFIKECELVQSSDIPDVLFLSHPKNGFMFPFPAESIRVYDELAGDYVAGRVRVRATEEQHERDVATDHASTG